MKGWRQRLGIGLAGLVAVVGLAGLAILASACATAKPTFDTPKAQGVYTVDQVALRVNELERAAIAAQAGGGLPLATTRTIVQWTVATDRVLQQAPAGWSATVAASWDLAKQAAGPITNPAVVAAMGLVDVALAAVGGAR